MKVCPRCGTDNADAANYCGSCASQLQQAAARTCPSGRHTMDPGWSECPYCRQDNASSVRGSASSARRATVVEGAPLPPSSAAQRVTMREDAPRTYSAGQAGQRVTLREDAPPTPRPPRVVPQQAPSSPVPPGRVRPRTEFADPGASSASGSLSAPSVQRDRKIVGILITYSWIPEGRVFPVREGRNFIGRDADCDICVPEDKTMSGRNSHITYRQNFVVGDLVSMTGTDLDGAPIEEQFRSLPNYATIRAGSTYFTFIAVAPPRAEAATPEEGAVSS